MKRIKKRQLKKYYKNKLWGEFAAIISQIVYGTEKVVQDISRKGKK